MPPALVDGLAVEPIATPYYPLPSQLHRPHSGRLFRNAYNSAFLSLRALAEADGGQHHGNGCWAS